MLQRLLNNKFSIIILLSVLIGLILLFKTYSTKKKVSFNENINKVLEPDKFIENNKFIGIKKGYVFKKGESGLGYYLDS
jgi:hypothetical protein